jgi:hypothetical protein
MSTLERAEGFEPLIPTLEGCALPLSYTRILAVAPVGRSPMRGSPVTRKEEITERENAADVCGRA